jgi:hypothetical protein
MLTRGKYHVTELGLVENGAEASAYESRHFYASKARSFSWPEYVHSIASDGCNGDAIKDEELLDPTNRQIVSRPSNLLFYIYKD